MHCFYFTQTFGTLYRYNSSPHISSNSFLWRKWYLNENVMWFLNHRKQLFQIHRHWVVSTVRLWDYHQTKSTFNVHLYCEVWLKMCKQAVEHTKPSFMMNVLCLKTVPLPTIPTITVLKKRYILSIAILKLTVDWASNSSTLL